MAVQNVGRNHDDTRHHRHGCRACGIWRSRAFGRRQHRPCRFMYSDSGLCADPRGESVPVRAEPTQQSAVIGTLSGRAANGELARSQVTIMGSQSGWARVALNTAQGYSRRGCRAAVVRLDAGRSAHGRCPRRRHDHSYDRPDLLGSAIATIEGDDMKFRVLGCRGSRLQVVNARLRPRLDRQVVRPRGGLPRLETVWKGDGSSSGDLTASLRDSSTENPAGRPAGFFLRLRSSVR